MMDNLSRRQGLILTIALVILIPYGISVLYDWTSQPRYNWEDIRTCEDMERVAEKIPADSTYYELKSGDIVFQRLSFDSWGRTLHLRARFNLLGTSKHTLYIRPNGYPFQDIIALDPGDHLDRLNGKVAFRSDGGCVLIHAP